MLYVGEAITSTLEKIYKVLADGATSSVTFLSQILTKFCLIGYAGNDLLVFKKKKERPLLNKLQSRKQTINRLPECCEIER